LFASIPVGVGAIAIAWESPNARRRLPVSRPFTMRCHDLWVDGGPIRDELRRLSNETQNDIPETTWNSLVDWDRRVWDTILQEDRERGHLAEEAVGGRLANRTARLGLADASRHVSAIREVLVRLIEA
jgi:hypothetical protein